MISPIPYFATHPAGIVSHNPWLAINFASDGGMRIAVKQKKRAQLKSEQPKRSAKVLNLLPSSGPFFVYAKAEQYTQDQGIDQRLCEVGLDHHVKVDHA